MANCDEFPEFYFEDSQGKFPWDYPSWGDDWSHPIYFETFEEASLWAKDNPGEVITRSSDGEGFMIKE